ncbi:uncharacterized protein LOC126656854 [Mercurialis annua]|uniref:uncharacterized protein LOC126656854 n=1 Tax=Mercurialis annua TaxID=3986 RepID=UPI00215F929D|nr:uncharacterized protein LOC126656854 [Mercurialis annua]
MAVREYIDRFEELCKFASKIFPTEAQKYYRFKEGLQAILRMSYHCMREHSSERPQSHDSNFLVRQPASSVGSVASKKRSITCFECGGMGHIIRDCPSMEQFSSGRGRGFQGTTNRGGRTSGFDRGSGRGSGFNANKEANSPDVIFGRLTIFGRDAYVLIDPSATHSFIVSSFISCIPRDKSVMNHALVVHLPVAQSVVCQHVYKDCEIHIGDYKFEVDLVPLVLQMFDVIVGMDVLSKYKAVVDCYSKRIQKKGVKLENIHVVNKFADVFPDNLPGLPPDRAIEFSVDLQSGTNPISQAPYRMAQAELKEPKV